MRFVLLTTVAVAAIALTAEAQAAPHRWDHLTLRQTIAAQRQLIRHDRQVIARWRESRWHTSASHADWSVAWATERSLALPVPWRVHYALEHLRWTSRELHERLRLVRARTPTGPREVICAVFGSYCSQALAVASCESHLSTTASNGQYLGMFQMGDYARAHYGHGSDALSQAKAAYAYFVSSGRDWSPWSCKP